MRWNDKKRRYTSSILICDSQLSASLLEDLNVVQQYVYHNYDVKECLCIHETTGEVWISLEHNITDTAANEWKNRLHVCDCTIDQHFDQFYCRQLKTKQ